jgi:nucleoid-associated protein YgaU
MSRSQSSPAAGTELREKPTSSKREPAGQRSVQQQLALEKKLGLGIIGILLCIFFSVLGMRVGSFGWSEEKVEINIGGTGTMAAATAANSTPKPRNDPPPTIVPERTDPRQIVAAPAANLPPTDYAPPKIYLPPTPPVVSESIGAWPPKAPKQVAAGPQTVAPSTVVLPNAAAVAAASPPVSSPPTSNAAAPVRQPGVAAIGLASGTGPVTTNRAVPASATMPIAASPSNSSPAATHVFAEGDNFWTIAAAAYGDGAYYRALFAYNGDRYKHAEDLQAGDVIDTPPVEVLRSKYPELCPASGSGTTPASANLPMGRPQQAQTAAARTYVVQEGDTLFEIARRELGKASLWSDIYALNRAVLGENLTRLEPGTTLQLPPATTQTDGSR